ncbi:MAG: C45 family autoproteolytic acyltransferase/hydrolase, partial [Acidimicrobiales bacterium]
LLGVEWDGPGDPLVFSVGVGPWISVGWNGAGLSLTGNEVSPNDERAGVPRLLLVRAQLRARTLSEAVALALHPDRASAYNTVFAMADGEAVDVEASATDCECTGPDESGAIVHTNHYVGERMARYEDDPGYALRSERRRQRALRLLQELQPSRTTVEALRGVLSDHENGPDAICRHGGDGTEVKTVFWCVADVTDRRVTYGRGNPCHSAAQTYAFP